MLISYNWLRDLTGTKLAPRALAERLTMVGLAVDAVNERGSDHVLEFDLTSNRPDCLSHLGIAREVAVIERGALRLPESKIERVARQTRDFASVEIEDADLCPRYAARVVRGVRVAPSPAWLVERLESVGQRAINNVTDITNYVLQEQGQPLHAFDLAKLEGNRIVVRRARKEEKIRTLDGVERELDAEMLVIADAARPLAIAGVMGGEDSAVYDETQDVLIESAYFAPAQIRQTARALNLHTEASNHFERGADPEAVISAQERAISLICEIAGGEATEDYIDVYAKRTEPIEVNLRYQRIEELTGLQIVSQDAIRILSSLGFSSRDARREGDENVLAVTNDSEHSQAQQSNFFAVPTWRVDIEREEDLIEEVARHTGYERIVPALPVARGAGEYLPFEERRRAARETLVASGFDEAINFSFIDVSADNLFELLPGWEETEESGFVSLKNPIVEGATRMRPTLLPGLLEAVRHNFNHGTRDVELFETGRVFAAAEQRAGERPREREALALVATGGRRQVLRAGVSRSLDFYDLKDALEALAEEINVGELKFEAARVRHLREGQAAHVLVDGRKIGNAGKLADDVAERYKFRQAVYLAEIDFEWLLSLQTTASRYTPLARFPKVLRDVSLLADRPRTFAEMRGGVLELNIPECHGVYLVEVYEGANVPEGKRSVTLRMEYQAIDRTLRDAEVDELHKRVLNELKKRFDVQLRE
ncbi:MAG: phenylalanine--tRNA ligase subunit beta [Pyrinomonadaceae bacterium]|nr:phenylalanine--tRNA ligase subunit beta [Pyrinomonadaceae bacterium]